MVDIGNTFTKIAWFDQGEIVECQRLDRPGPEHLNRIIRNRPAERAILSSVGKAKSAFTYDWARNHKNLIILDHHTPLPIQIEYKTPGTLGQDRIAACAGARQLFPGHPVLIFDLGTAITIDFVTAEGEYLGGNISPGLYTRFRALHSFTVKLPLVEADSAFPAFGTDTRTAIASGVQEGIVFELNGYLDDYAFRYPDCKFIITGGDAGFFVPRLKRTVLFKPELVLNGLNYILEFNSPQGNS